MKTEQIPKYHESMKYKQHDQTRQRNDEQINDTYLTVDKDRSSPSFNRNKKSQSMKVLSTKQLVIQQKQQLDNLKEKIQLSKQILTTIHHKVKMKQSAYKLQISKKDLNLSRVKKLANDYKVLYEDGLKLVQSSIDRNLNTHSSKQQLKNKILEKARQKKLQLHKKKQSGQITQFNPFKHKKSSQIPKTQSKSKQKPINEQTPISKLKKSTSHYNISSKPSQPFQPQSRASLGSKSSLYDLYKQRLQKRVQSSTPISIKNSKDVIKSLGPSLMHQFNEQIQQNLNQLRLIRKNSQLRLSSKTQKARQDIQRQQKRFYHKQQQNKLKNLQ